MDLYAAAEEMAAKFQPKMGSPAAGWFAVE